MEQGPLMISYRMLRDGGACSAGIRSYFPALRAAGVEIPRAYSTLEVPLLTILDVLGYDAVREALEYARPNDGRVRLFVAEQTWRSFRYLVNGYPGATASRNLAVAEKILRCLYRGQEPRDLPDLVAEVEDRHQVQLNVLLDGRSSSWPLTYYWHYGDRFDGAKTRLRAYLVGESVEPLVSILEPT